MDVSENDVRRWGLVQELCARISRSSNQADVDALRAEIRALTATASGRTCIRDGLKAIADGRKFALRELANILAETSDSVVPYAEQRLLLAAAAQAAKLKPEKDPVFWVIPWLRLERGDTAAGAETARTVEKIVKERKGGLESVLDGVAALRQVPPARRLALFEQVAKARLSEDAQKAVDAYLSGLLAAPPEGVQPQTKSPVQQAAKAEPPAKPTAASPAAEGEPAAVRSPAPEVPVPTREPPVPFAPPVAKFEMPVSPREIQAKAEGTTAQEEEKPTPARSQPKERESGSARKAPEPEADNREEAPPVGTFRLFGGRKPPALSAPHWSEAAAPLLALLGEMAEKIDALHSRALAEDERARDVQTEHRRRASDHETELTKARAEAEAAEQERDRLAGELDESREALKRARERADELTHDLADARGKAEKAERDIEQARRDAEQAEHHAELVKETCVDSFRAELGEVLRRIVPDVPDPIPPSKPEGEQILLRRILAIRQVLRERDVRLD